MKGLVAFTVLAIACLQVASGQAKSEDQLKATVERIMKDYDPLAMSHPDSDYGKAYQGFKTMFENGKATLRITQQPCTSLLAALSFSVSLDKKESWIDFNSISLNMYDAHKSLVLSMLSHELWHCYAYHQDPVGFMDKNTDPFEDTLYEVDAYQVEGEFISDVLIPGNYSISKFEKFLYDCYRANSLFNFTAVFRGEDLNIVRALYAIKENRRTAKIDQDTVYRQSTQIGKQVLSDNENLSSAKDRYSQFLGWVEVNTFDRFVQTLANETETKRKTWAEVRDNYPELWSIVQKAGQITTKQATNMDAYRKTLVAFLDVPAK